MAEDLSIMKEVLGLSKVEQRSVMVPLGSWQGESEVPGFHMVGRLLGNRSFNSEAMKNTLMNVFNPITGLDIRLIENALEEDDDPVSVDLDWANFCVHIHSLSLGRISRNMAELIGNQIGQFRDIEFDSGGQFWGSSLWIRVGIDVTKPLRQVLKMHTSMGSESTITFIYERLPNYCYWCGCLGHILKFCACQYEPGFDALKDPLPFGPWLRATTPTNLRSRGTKTPVTRPSFTPQNSTDPPPTFSRRGSAIFHYSAPSCPATSIPTPRALTSSPSFSNICPPPYTSSLLTTPLTLPTNQTLTPLICPTISSISPTIPSLTSTINPITESHNPTITPSLNVALRDVPLTFSATVEPSLSISHHPLPIRLKAIRNQLAKLYLFPVNVN
ncbi:hypothetical protein Salat_2099000 [Sesamum alatum]|uniref:Zinc knuckle CX2CX4HX4C domain-containing protein n=1 Tax=Sesamum alatum TaxID=300844 RepID=A0AAE1Y1H8_9LAMI|nr:hypothetical protein Salat_2099000 [Sesamum alatum]